MLCYVMLCKIVGGALFRERSERKKKLTPCSRLLHSIAYITVIVLL